MPRWITKRACNLSHQAGIFFAYLDLYSHEAERRLALAPLSCVGLACNNDTLFSRKLLPENLIQGNCLVFRAVKPFRFSETLFGETPESKTDAERGAIKPIR